VTQKNPDSHPLEGSSNRMFGFVMAVFFVFVGVMPLFSGQPLRSWALVLAGAFLTLAVLWPGSLARLNQAWMRLGLLMSVIVSPVAMGIVFFGVITPMGLLMKLFGKKLMPLGFEPDAPSYWIKRDRAGQEPQSMKNSF